MSEPHVARLEGEIDLANYAAVEAEVLAGVGDASALVVDLSAVTYFDSSGMRMLDGLARACREADIPLHVVAPEGSPARMILHVVAWPAELIAESLDDAPAGSA